MQKIYTTILICSI